MIRVAGNAPSHVPGPQLIKRSTAVGNGQQMRDYSKSKETETVEIGDSGELSIVYCSLGAPFYFWAVIVLLL